MVTAIAPESASSNSNPSGLTKRPTPKTGTRNRLLTQSQPIHIDFTALPAPTSPLPIPDTNTPPPGSPSRTAPRKLPHDKVSSPTTLTSGSLRPPPRPRSIVSHITLCNPPTESLPPVPVILHSSETPTSPISPISPSTPSFYSSFSQPQDRSLSRSLPSSAIRSSSVGRVSGVKNRPSRKAFNPSDISDGHATLGEEYRGRPSPTSTGLQQTQKNLMSNMEDPVSTNPMQVPETERAEHRLPLIKDLPLRSVDLIATRFYGIESSMRWREGVDPIQKRFSSSNGSWRCQDRFAIFFRPGDQIGPDQMVTKTFWSEAWPYPIETVLYGTTDQVSAGDEAEREFSGHRSDHESDRQMSRGRVGTRVALPDTHLKAAASFPPLVGNRDPRYITSEGVHKIAKVIIPMPDVAIHQMDLVKAPVKVELRIFLLESPLRINATATLLGKTVAGTTELYV
ncbi:hypothetical protein BGZ51_001808 [Haplosporangium sp. Z 767]|nr:hypothetical protein BGZ50_006557 [Haplosporangium sp. Z 11]KAF9186676.1 hypothetical protein BGZ51_001808 [Haplosporangium sp. Z 767]